MATAEKTVTVNINAILDGNPVGLKFVRQAVKEKIERDAAKRGSCSEHDWA